MTLEEGIQLKGFGVEIPNIGRDDLPQFFVERGYKVGAEIGTYKGEFCEKFCQAGLKMYAIDPWKTYNNYHRHPQEKPYDELYEEAKTRLAPYDCTLIRKQSMEALADIPNDSLDFVYIDGNHTIRYVIEDLYEWYRKVKVGGAICGHDYGITNRSAYRTQACHVKYAVDLMAKILGIENWYILGTKNSVPGEKRDKWRSFLWIKT